GEAAGGGKGAGAAPGAAAAEGDATAAAAAALAGGPAPFAGERGSLQRKAAEHDHKKPTSRQ
ncbi:unnamed protein product, partial [Adineta steineri]